jgi:hypothetical protein
MEIEWTIKKNRGRIRPELIYSISWEKWEESLNPEIKAVTIDRSTNGNSTGLLSDDMQNYIDQPRYQWIIESQPEKEAVINLRYYGNNHQYPEIKEAFMRLLKLHEAAIKEAYDQRPLDLAGNLETSDDLKKYVAPGLTAEKMKAA